MREPAVVAETPPDPDVDGAIIGVLPGHARGVQGHRPRRRPGRPRADHRRERHRQGTGRPRHLPARPAGQGTVPGPQLRRHPGEPAGERAVRAREGVPSPAPTAAASASSSSATAARSSSTRSATCRRRLQAKILRLLQEQAFERVGGNETIRTDVRLIAATHRDLKAWSEEGKFRPDLYYRLGVFTIHLPPLRERGDDLPMLVQHFLRRFSRELGREVREVAPEAMERLRALLLAGQHPRAAERAEAGVAPVDRPGPAPDVSARPRPTQGDRAGHGVRARDPSSRR